MEVKYTDAEFKPEDVPVSFELAYVGMRVKRGPDWMKSYANQDMSGFGTIIEMTGEIGKKYKNIVKVQWDSENYNYYRAGGYWDGFGEEGQSSRTEFYDLVAVPGRESEEREEIVKELIKILREGQIGWVK